MPSPWGRYSFTGTGTHIQVALVRSSALDSSGNGKWPFQRTRMEDRKPPAVGN